MKKRIVAIMLSAVMVFNLSACGNSSKTNENSGSAVEAESTEENLGEMKEVDESRKLSSSSERADKIVIGISGDPTDLNPTYPNATGKNVVLPEIYEALCDIEGDEYIPVLMKEYTVVDDMHYEVEIHDNIYDSEGNHITAADVVYSYNWLVESGNVNRYELFGGIEQTDEYKVMFTWTSPIIALAALDWIWCRTYIFSEKAMAEHNFATDPVATGPYVVSSFTSGSSVVLEANDKYWQTDESLIRDAHRANVQTIEYRVITEASQRVIGLETGSIDYAEAVDQNNVGEFADGGKYADQYNVYNTYENRNYLMFPNANEGKFGNDVNFRKALFYAISNDALAETIGGAIGACTMGNPYYSDYQTKWESDDNYMTTFDQELAKEYLSKSSYNGETLKLICVNLEVVQNMAQMIQAFLLNIGVNVEIETYEQATLDVLIMDPDSWDLAVYRCGHDAYQIGAWNILMNRNDRESGMTINFVNDDELQRQFELCSTAEGHTDENMDALQQYWIDNAYYTGLIVLLMNTVYADKIAELYYNGSGALIPGGCTYYLD